MTKKFDMRVKAVEQWLIDNPAGGRSVVIGKDVNIPGKNGALAELRHLSERGKVIKIINNLGTVYQHFKYSIPEICKYWPDPVKVPEGGQATVYNLLTRGEK